jgi:heptosyltransferase-3
MLPQKILVIKLRHHGDVLLTTAFLRHLRLRFPAAEIHFLIYKETTPLVSHNEDITQLWTVDRSVKGWARIKAEFSLLLRTRQAGFDVLIHQTDQWTGALASLLSGARKRVSFLFFKRDNWLWKCCFTHLVPQPPHDTVHAVAYNFLLLPPLQLPGQLADLSRVAPDTAPCHLPVPAGLAAQARDRLTAAGVNKPFVLMHPPARWPCKCWEDERFSEVVDHVVAKGFQVVLTSGPAASEVAMVDAVLAQCKVAKTGIDVLSLAGKVNLPLVAAFLKQCSFYVGVDSAPMHMAAALNVPQVCLFGPTRINEWRPWSDKAILIDARDYGWVPSVDGLDTTTDERYLNPIQTQTVLGAVDQLVQRHGETP